MRRVYDKTRVSFHYCPLTLVVCSGYTSCCQLLGHLNAVAYVLSLHLMYCLQL